MDWHKFVDALDASDRDELRGILAVQGSMLLNAEVELLRRGDLIGAIKSLRHRTGMDLRSAKDLCESNPAWRRS